MTTANVHSHDELIRARLSDSTAVTEAMRQDSDIVTAIENIANALIGASRQGRKVLLCGNGGSAADAQHIAAELVGRFRKDREPLAAIALAANSSTVTALGNDFSFDDIFARQVRGLGRQGDVLVGFTTSGNSENVVRALETAMETGLATAVLTGSTGGRVEEMSNICLRIPSDDTARIQEGHITAAHIICELVEAALA